MVILLSLMIIDGAIAYLGHPDLHSICYSAIILTIKKMLIPFGVNNSDYDVTCLWQRLISKEKKHGDGNPNNENSNGYQGKKFLFRFNPESLPAFS